MPFTAGARLGPYELVALIGTGGMGDVYRARDTRLDRIVAVKVLREHLASAPDRRARFEREARTVSKLSHPNICTLFDVGHDGAADYLVVEYLDGQSLAERLQRGPLAVEQALTVAIQIAGALDAAHRVGIIHRDVKPANVMLSKSGAGSTDSMQAKLLDFGIARMIAAVPDTSCTPAVRADTLTIDGVLLGSVQYMAPEQLEGRDADARSDIFAFGAMLFETLTGARAFAGGTQASVIAAVLEHDPVLSGDIEPALNRLVRKCLAKDPEARWQTARDLRDELQWIADGRRQAASLRPQQTFRRLGWLVAGLCLLGAIAASSVAYFARPAIDTNVYRSTFSPPEALTDLHALALSPDGRRLALTAPDATGHVVLWVRPLDGLSQQPLTGTEGASAPFWSPDSRSIGFFADGKLKRVDASGGPVRTLTDGNATGTWSKDDVILFTVGPEGTGFSRPSVGSRIARIAASGGTPTVITTLDGHEALHGYPSFLPDGRHFLFAALTAAELGSVYVGSLDSPSRIPLIRHLTNARYAQGELLFLSDTTLMAQPFDLERLRLTGDAVSVAEDVWGPSLGQQTGAFTVSDTGVLAFQRGANARLSRLVWLDRAGHEISKLGAGENYGSFGNPSAHLNLSPDGRRAAVVLSAHDAHADIWVVDVARGTRTRLTFDPSAAGAPIWSPDGRSIVFRSTRDGRQNLYQKASSGAGTDTLLLADAFNKIPESWAPDGQHILYYSHGRSGSSELMVVPLFGDRKPFPFIESPSTKVLSQFSPDGKWVAYGSNETGRYEVFVAAFPHPSGKWQITTGGGREPRWRQDGSELFYLTGNTLMVAAVKGEADRFEVRDVKRLFDLRLLPGANAVYDVAPNGQRVLANVADEQPTAPSPVTVVVNWRGLLKH